MSSAEAEFVSLSACCAQVIWMRTQLLDYGYRYHKIPIYCDSKSEISISCNPVQHSRTKHINIRYHFIKEHVEKGTIELYFVGTEYQIADLFTKSLPKERFEFLVHKIVFHMAQHSIPCSPECKIVGQILLDHPLSYALTDTADVSAVYLQKIWRTKKEAIQYPHFIKLIIADLMKKFPNIPKRLDEDYHSIKDDVPLVSVIRSNESTATGCFYPGTNRNIPRAPRTPTVFSSPQETKKRKQTAGESSSRRIITKKKKQSTPSIPPPGDDKERDEMAEATILSLTLHKTILDAKSKENIAKVQEMLAQEEIDKLVDGDEDEESSASAFADIVLNDNDDDTGSKLETRSHKEHPEHVSDDNKKKKKKDEEVEKENKVVEIVKETTIDDTSAKMNEEVMMKKEVVDMSGSQEIRKEQKHIPIPLPIRSPRNDLTLGNIILEEFTDTIPPTTATSSKTPSTTTRKKKSFSHTTRNLPGSIVGMCRQRGLIRSYIKNKFITQEFFADKIKEVIQHCNAIDRDVSPGNISGMVSKEFAAHAPKMIKELFRQHMQNTTLNLYPKSHSLTVTTSSADLQQQLYHTIKAKPQDQAADLKIWESLKAKFEMP
ncbi:hypothetical protein Tco_0588731 [Tanacetum coccineum]